MKVTIKVEKEVDVKTLHVSAGVRYWKDASVCGVDDDEGDLIPCREGDLWKPIIDIESGVILNWNRGKSADIYYKVCDNGRYFLRDDSGETVLSIVDDYVPDILCPGGRGYGDYIIMHVNENGQIKNWKPDLSDFIKED